MSVEQIFCIFPNSIFLSFAEPPFHALRAKKIEIYSTNQINSTHTDMMNNLNNRQSMFILNMKTFDSAMISTHNMNVELYIETLLILCITSGNTDRCIFQEKNYVQTYIIVYAWVICNVMDVSSSKQQL